MRPASRNGSVTVWRVFFFLIALLGMMVISYGQAKEMRIRFSVLDEKDEPFQTLKVEDVTVTVNKRAAQVKSVSAASDSSLRVLILIDASASQERVLPAEKKIAEYFIDRVLKTDRDTVGIAKFTGIMNLLYEPNRNFTEAKSKLGTIAFEPPVGYIGGGIIAGSSVSGISKAQGQAGSTSIFDALVKSSASLASNNQQGSRPLILLISDGVNTYGDNNLKAAINEVIKNGVAVYAIGVGDENYSGVDESTLRKLASFTGGSAVFPNKKLSNVDAIIAKLRNSLLSGYEVTFAASPTDSTGLTETLIQIIDPQLKTKKFQIFQPKGIYASN